MAMKRQSYRLIFPYRIQYLQINFPAFNKDSHRHFSFLLSHAQVKLMHWSLNGFPNYGSSNVHRASWFVT